MINTLFINSNSSSSTTLTWLPFPRVFHLFACLLFSLCPLPPGPFSFVLPFQLYSSIWVTTPRVILLLPPSIDVQTRVRSLHPAQSQPQRAKQNWELVTLHHSSPRWACNRKDTKDRGLSGNRRRKYFNSWWGWVGCWGSECLSVDHKTDQHTSPSRTVALSAGCTLAHPGFTCWGPGIEASQVISWK